MKDLDLLGPDAEGAFLTLADADGRRYRLPITPSLRSAVRTDRRALAARLTGQPRLSPRDIQALLRSGATVEDVVERTGADEARIESYAAPVHAERAYIAQRARTLRVGHVSDAPNLGDLVTDRLAAREVPADAIVWDATRSDGHPWEVRVTFPVGSAEHEARWSVDLDRHVLTALDDESRWLSETDIASRGRRTLPGTGIFTGPGLRSADAPQEDRDSLLAQLSASRGTRSEATDPEAMAALDAQEDAREAAHLAADGGEDRGEESVPRESRETAPDDGHSHVWDDVPGAHPADSHPHEAPDAEILSLADRKARTDQQNRAAHPSAGPRPEVPVASDADAGSDSDEAGTEGTDANGGANEDAAAGAEAHSHLPEDSRAAKDSDSAQAPAPASGDEVSGMAEAPTRAEDSPAAQDAPSSAGPEQEALDVELPATPPNAPTAQKAPSARSKRKGSRRSVPSWDEIVFGTRGD